MGFQSLMEDRDPSNIVFALHHTHEVPFVLTSCPLLSNLALTYALAQWMKQIQMIKNKAKHPFQSLLLSSVTIKQICCTLLIYICLPPPPPKGLKDLEAATQFEAMQTVLVSVCMGEQEILSL